MSTQQIFVDAAKAFVEAKAAATRAQAAMFDAYNALVNETPIDGTDAQVDERRRDDYRRHAIYIERKRRTWSQQRLGDALGFPSSTAQARVSQIEGGFRAIPDDLFNRVANLFEMPAAKLEAAGREACGRWQQRLLETLRCAIEPLSIAALCDRAELSTSDGWAELEPLVNTNRVLKVPGGFVINEVRS